MFRKKINFAIVLAFFVLLVGSVSATTYYVDPNGDDDANGLSWATAFETIQEGIDSSSTDDIVEVNEGTYYETINFGRKDIILRSTDPNDWDVVESTIIDANGGSYALTYGGTTQGFTITGASSQGVRCWMSDETVIEKCIIEDCGIGVFAMCTSADINNCIIRDNSSVGVYIDYTDGTNIKNNIIFNNYGGIYTDSEGGNIIIRNNTIVSNSTYGIKDSSAQPTISNCIIWDCNDDLNNCSATYSCIEDGDGGTGNISSDPCFVDDVNDDYHIAPDSPCFNSGDPNGSYDGETDIDNDERVQGIAIDMGADEYGVIYYYVDPNGNDSNDGTSWSTAFATIQKGIDEAKLVEPNYVVIDVNSGTYETGPIWVDNDNLHFIFEENVIVEAQSNNYDPEYDPNDPNNPFRIDPNSPSNGDCLFTISFANNIILDGNDTIFRMKKSEHEAYEPVPGYSRHVIRLRGIVDNVEIRGLTLKDSRGCGIILSWCGISSNILIEDVNCINNTMAAICVCGGEGITIQNSILRDYTVGANAETGIDFEASFSYQPMKDIIMRNVTITDSNGYGTGIIVHLNAVDSSEDVNIVIEDVNVVGNRIGIISYLKANHVSGSIKFKNVTVENSNCCGAYFLTSSDGATFSMENCIIKDIGSSPARWPITIVPYYDRPGGVEFINCQVFDDRDRPAIKFSNVDLPGDINNLYEIYGDIHVQNPNCSGEFYDWSDANLHNVELTIHDGLACIDTNDINLNDPNVWNDVNDLQVWDFYLLDANDKVYKCSKKYVYAASNLDANHCKTAAGNPIPHYHFESDFNEVEITAANRYWDWFFDVNSSGIVRDSNATNQRNGLAYAMDNYATGANYGYWIVPCEISDKIFTDDCTKDNGQPATSADVDDRLAYNDFGDIYRHVTIVNSVDGNEPNEIQWKRWYSGVYRYANSGASDHFSTPARDDVNQPIGVSPSGTWDPNYWDSNDADVYY
ncbi:MAG: right-handed parallel beta-helix repeat-containing protein [Planctomycetota bacterium]|jgi:hypothetical protein